MPFGFGYYMAALDITWQLKCVATGLLFSSATPLSFGLDITVGLLVVFRNGHNQWSGFGLGFHCCVFLALYGLKLMDSFGACFTLIYAAVHKPMDTF
jgi:hypothetical protein